MLPQFKAARGLLTTWAAGRQAARSTLRRGAGFSTDAAASSGGGVWGAYMRALEKYPVTTKCITSGVLACGSDFLCQKIDKAYSITSKEEEKNNEKPYDWERTARFSFLGTFYMAPILHVWYGFLMRSFAGTSALVTVKRVALDQLVFAPIYLSGLFSVNMALEGQSDKIEAKLRADLFNTIKANFSVWVPVMAIGFKFIPANLQVQYSNVVGFFWNIYLSFSLAKEVEEGTSDYEKVEK